MKWQVAAPGVKARIMMLRIQILYTKGLLQSVKCIKLALKPITTTGISFFINLSRKGNRKSLRVIKKRQYKNLVEYAEIPYNTTR